MALPAVRSKVVILELFIYCLLLLPLFVSFSFSGSLFGGVIRGILSGFAIILLRKRELVALCCVCLCSVAPPNGAIHVLQSVIVVFPGHIHLLFDGLQCDH